MPDKNTFHALLIFGADVNLRKAEAENLINHRHGTERQDVRAIQPDGKSIGIDAIRQLKEWLSFKPSKGTNKTAVIFEAQEMTIEAQNSLLKTLEEPPLKTTVILTVSNKQTLLPTVISRCFLKELKTSLEGKENTPERKNSAIYSIKHLLGLSTKDKLDLIENNAKVISNREEILLVIDEWIRQVREDLIKVETPSKNGGLINKVNIIDQLISAKNIISETNTGIRLHIESLLLGQIFTLTSE